MQDVNNKESTKHISREEKIQEIAHKEKTKEPSQINLIFHLKTLRDGQNKDHIEKKGAEENRSILRWKKDQQNGVMIKQEKPINECQEQQFKLKHQSLQKRMLILRQAKGGQINLLESIIQLGIKGFQNHEKLYQNIKIFMQSPSYQKSKENSTQSEQFTYGWLPIKNDVEQSIVTYLDQLGINQLIQVEKHSNQRNSLYSLDTAVTPPKSQRRISLTMDSELFQRRSFRMCSDQI